MEDARDTGNQLLPVLHERIGGLRDRGLTRLAGGQRILHRGALAGQHHRTDRHVL